MRALERVLGTLGPARAALLCCVAYVLIGVLLLGLPGCRAGHSSAEPTVRTALNVLADAINPAYRLAMVACAARDDQIVADAERKRITVAEADRLRAELGPRCRALEEAFESARNAHDQAVAYVEQGKLEEAEAIVADLRARVRNLEPPEGPPEPVAAPDGGA